MRLNLLRYIVLIFSLYLLVGCGTTESSDTDDTIVRIRVADEPDRLHPLLSTQSSATQIERLLFLPLQDYDPKTLELRPILLTDRPTIETQDDGSGEMIMELLPDARWPNGSQITGKDYLFTMKVALNPYMENARWGTFVRQLDQVSVLEDNPQQVRIQANTFNLNTEEIATGFPLYPSYFYDSSGIMDQFTYAELLSWSVDSIGDRDLMLKEFAKDFGSVLYSRRAPTGAGAYQLVDWQAQQSMVLTRRGDWWGDRYAERHTLLEAKPEEVQYYFIQEEQTALTSLKDERLDLVSQISPEQFENLKKEESTLPIKLYAPAILQYYYIAYNNANDKLKNTATRKAISHAMDLEGLLANLFYGDGMLTIGPIHPSKSQYANEVKPLQKDLNRSRELLEQDGWQDSDGDGVMDRMQNGVRQELKLRILTTRSQLSQDVAILLKDGAKDVGIALEIVPMDFRNLLQEVRNGTYDLACLASRPPLGMYDPYASWHSDNIGASGSNLCRVNNAELDKVIEEIRSSSLTTDLTPKFLEFQRVLHEEHPALFLVAPATRIALNSDFEMVTSSMRPGFFENTITSF